MAGISYGSPAPLLPQPYNHSTAGMFILTILSLAKFIVTNLGAYCPLAAGLLYLTHSAPFLYWALVTHYLDGLSSPLLTWKPTRVTTINKVKNKEIKLTSYVFDTVYCQENVPTAMIEKVKPVLDTSYKPYVSDGNQEDNNKPEFYRTTEGQLVLKKVTAFYNKVPMPCKPVTNQDPGLFKPTKPSWKLIPYINCIILLRLMQEYGS
ncbi:hypothetical protein DSO57_1024254 [Entomophthora muscae]|uniref:Uncharacterized protein n=1 Tax=Entomophthora muscae TaxID=34485 RepID=A0ACC2RHC3_9FUNG|nr:hypothetical protein DSO57_1024254 [Entomophthora muscae]